MKKMTKNCLFLTRVVLKNYRSIEACDVKLGPLTFLVGPNGSGKSNFVDAIRLVFDALNTSLDHALRDRGGINEVRRRSSGHPTHFAIRLEFILSNGSTGHFAFEVGAKPKGGFIVKKEECFIGGGAKYIVQDGNVTFSSLEIYPPASSDRLYLVNAAGLPQFRRVFNELSKMGFYNVNPDAIRALQAPDAGDMLRRDGGNLASVVARMSKGTGDVKERIAAYLGQVVPGLVGFDVKTVGHMETLEFRQNVKGAPAPWRFPAINMSDGTLRALATLVALFQTNTLDEVRLIGIEEPETALHPAASGVLRDCVIEASAFVQVLVTSHSADLLDDPGIDETSIRAVESEGGKTFIAPLDVAARKALKDRLYTPGELLRANQLAPDVGSIPDSSQLEMFGVDS